MKKKNRRTTAGTFRLRGLEKRRGTEKSGKTVPEEMKAKFEEREDGGGDNVKK